MALYVDTINRRKVEDVPDSPELQAVMLDFEFALTLPLPVPC